MSFLADHGVTLLAVSEDLRPLVKWIVWQPQSDSNKYGAVVSLCNQEYSHSPLYKFAPSNFAQNRPNWGSIFAVFKDPNTGAYDREARVSTE